MDTLYFTDSQSLDSSVLDRVYYDNVDETLVVAFHNGHKAGYADVPRHEYDDLVKASSPGRYYNQEIKGYYAGVDTGGELKLRAAELAIAPDAPVHTDVVHLSMATPAGARTFNVVVEVQATSIENAIDAVKGVGTVVSVARV